VALFPASAATHDGELCDSYEHIGQHGAADYAACIRCTMPARPSEYLNLARELRRIGYRLDIRKRATPAMRRNRKAETEL